MDKLSKQEFRQVMEESRLTNVLDKNFHKEEIHKHLHKSDNLSDLIANIKEDVKEVAKKQLISHLSKGEIEDAIKLLEDPIFSSEILSSPEMQDAAKMAIVGCAMSGYYNYAVTLQEGFKIPREIMHEIIRQEIASEISRHSFAYATNKEIPSNIPHEIFMSTEVQEAVKKEIIHLLSFGLVDYALSIQRQCHVPEEAITSPEGQAAIKEGIIKFLHNFQDNGIGSSEKPTIFEKMLASTEVQNAAKKEITASLSRGDMDNAIKIKEIVGTKDKYTDLIISIYQDKICDRKSIQYCMQNPEIIDRYIESGDRYALVKSCAEGLSSDIKKAFDDMESEFGIQTLTNYLGNYDRHDALHFSHDIITFSKLKGVEMKQILLQVGKDTSIHDGEDAYERFAEVVAYEKDINSVLAEASEFATQDMEKNIEVIRMNGIARWKDLENYYTIIKSLEQRESLEKIKELEKKGDNLKAEFFGKLIFNPEVNGDAVMKFLEDPAQFLDQNDHHSNHRLHNLKKPSNYTQLDHIDMSAEDLRDALIEQKLDQLQELTPYEAVYEITGKSILEMPPEALSQKEISNIAKQTNISFKVLKEIYSIPAEQRSRELMSKLTKEEVAKLEEALNIEKKEYKISIVPKSSPEGIVAGDATHCCMPFGSGKNNVYMYNLGCAMMLIEEKKPNKSYKTIAQSLMTKDADIGISIPEFFKKTVSNNEGNLVQSTKSNLAAHKKHLLVADSIEIARNERGKHDLVMLYRQFFNDYIKQTQQDIDSTQLLIGGEYNGNLRNLEQIKNTYLPLIPIPYSDNRHQTCSKLNLSQKYKSNIKKISENKKESQERLNPDLGKNIRLMRSTDNLAVTYLEGKAYADNESLMQYINKIGNEIQASMINNKIKGRPDLSIVHESEEGDIKGYMIAYEGVTNRDSEDQQATIYISDLAADPSSPTSGGRLIKAFLKLYEENYVNKNNPIPITAMARESTSYAIIRKQAENLGFTIQEGESYKAGKDTMHHIALIPKGIDINLAAELTSAATYHKNDYSETDYDEIDYENPTPW